ncbi:MAG: response regulator transcription factor [Spirosomataceae bacterium]|jgi:DNA-binding LytR/AlgR family response regulator
MTRPKVLIVEDEHITATEFKEALLSAGFDLPVIADRISTAIAEFDFYKFDLILLDITLKHDTLNGIFLAEYIRKTSMVPIIFITGDTDEITLEKIKSIANVDYMMKAVRAKELVIKAKLMIGKNENNKPKEPVYQEIVLLPIDKSHRKIKKSDIVAIEADGSYSNIYIVNEPTKHLMSLNMKSLLEGLQYPDFYKLNRSTVINVNFIEKLEKDQIVLSAFGLKYALQKGQKTEIMQVIPSIKTK